MKDSKSLIAIDREKALKKQRFETEELIDTLGQEDEIKGAYATIEYVAKQNEKDKIDRNNSLNYLKKLAMHRQAYQRFLINLLQEFIKEEKVSKKWQFSFESNDIGIILAIDGTTLTGAFRTCGDPSYDMNACKILAVQTGNTIAKLEGRILSTKSGILMADKIDLKIATKNYGR